MSQNYSLGIHLFRRDLRINDNTSFNTAVTSCAAVIPLFIFDPRQVGDENSYRSINAIQFMIESLHDLDDQLKEKGGKLFCFTGKAEEVIEKLITELPVDAVFVNKDYTPFSIKRDENLEKVCKKNQVRFMSLDDALLNPPEAITTGTGKPFSVYTPFFKRASQEPVAPPKTARSYALYAKSLQNCHSLNEIESILIPEKKEGLAVQGGTRAALKILSQLSKFKDYQKTRDYPAISTTLLSAHNKFGTVSIRRVHKEIVDTLGAHHGLVRQLYWRDFFYHVAFNFPHVFGKPFHEKYDQLEWDNDKALFKRWCAGETGFPIVDAGMRQLNQTGFMHNRLRMIVGSLLTKDLHIDWQWGEKYFAQHLVDYDPCVNNGSWQWVASTGCDAQPYFRIFNPWLQQIKFDSECVYIKRWVPELRSLSPAIIHNWYHDKNAHIKGYPRPMVDHSKEVVITKKRYKV